MGNCYTKQETQTFRNKMNKSQRPRKCIYLQNPSTLILQMSNGDVQNIPVKTNLSEVSFNYSVGCLYFSDNNQIFYVLQAQNLNDFQFLDAIHVYYLLTNRKQTEQQIKNCPIIQPQSAYFIKSQQKLFFIIKSKPLGQSNAKFADLIDLGKRLQQKQICWQDLQFSELIIQFCRKYSKVKGQQYCQISNIIIGTDGSLHLLSIFTEQAQESVLRRIQVLQSMWLGGLYGVQSVSKSPNSWWDFQNKMKFKHPQSLKYIQGLKDKIQQQSNNKYSRIANPSLKFIRDYVIAYYYKLNTCSQNMIDRLIQLRQWSKAKQLLLEYIFNNNFYQNINEQTYRIFKKLLKVQEAIDINSMQTVQVTTRVSTAAYYLAEKFKQTSNYKKSYEYFKQCLAYSRAHQDQNFYYSVSQVCRAISINQQLQSIINQGLKIYPKSRILHTQLIVYLCDCMRISQAEKQLGKSTPYFHTLEMAICSAKIFQAKSVMNSQRRVQFLKKSKQQLGNVVLQKYNKQTNTNGKHMIPYYHQVLGDIYLQGHQFDKAKQQYQISKILLKNDNVSGFKLANATAAEANCLMMQQKYDQSIALLNQALSTISDQCGTLYDSIKGNIAIAKIKKGLKEEGKFDIQQILNKIPRQKLNSDFNYIFLANVYKNAFS